MKVAVLFDRFGPYHIARLSAAARSACIVGLELSAETSTYAWNKVEHDGNFERVTIMPGGNTREFSKSEWRRRLENVLNEIMPEVVAIHGWSAPEALAALVWCKKNTVPVVIMSESTSWDFKRTRCRELVKRQILNLVDTALVGGAPHSAYLKQLGFPVDRIFLGYDVVDNDYFRNQAIVTKSNEKSEREKLGLPNPFFLASSRFIQKKNLEQLVSAFASYRDKVGVEAWDLVILGDGPLRSTLEMQCEKLKLRGALKLPGFMQYERLPSFYGLASVFVHASTTEQWGLVVNEAMASELPVLVSKNCGCAKDLVFDGVNGFTFDPYDIEELTRFLIYMAHGQINLKSMGHNSQKIISKWGPMRFSNGLQDSCSMALKLQRSNANVLSSMLLSILAFVR